MSKSNYRFEESDFEVKPSTIPGSGRGLFTRVLLRPGDTVGPYTGEIISDEESEQEPYTSSHYLLWVCRDCTIVGTNYTRFINHSTDPNVRFIVSTRWKTARVEATREISPGEELFLDYGPYFWEASEIQCLSTLSQNNVTQNCPP
jgi:hypothetical protein